MKMRRCQSQNSRSLCALGVPAVLTLIVGCDRLDMYDQPRYKPLAASNFFDDGRSARPRVDGTVARGELHDDEPLYTGKQAGLPVIQIPQAAYRTVQYGGPREVDQPLVRTDSTELRRTLLMRGRERFDINCSVCHGRTGNGDGMIVRRGFPKPPSLHIERLRDAPAGHFFDVMTNGLGAMPNYGNRISVEDRWAIVAYIRALQLSQNARIGDVPVDQRPNLSRPQSHTAEDQQ